MVQDGLDLEAAPASNSGRCDCLASNEEARAEGFADFAGYARFLSERFPLHLEGEPVPKIGEGIMCLNDPTQAQVCLATFQVSRTLIPLLGTVMRHDLVTPLPTGTSE